ncbi:hypothetical protein [Hymenobacter sp. YC55]|uniref:hypothetical protein n=1 Tax=Hymenobacter sp. YC55 TaxID=3034019 RepID=UPI0023F8E83E|nr:hypothetical protein [Hymenobacter sp. YC55]MDF7812225.1 hypothetical protein [Hymenobacter sp. YC55]
MLIDIICALLFLCIPSALITAYIAHMNDRSLWRWMAFGFCVPYVAAVIAMVVTYFDQKRSGELDE